jgi:hypothetical protein
MSASIPANRPSANPGLKDLLDVLHTNVLLSTNCHAVATVNTVPLANGNGLYTVNATMNYSRTYFTQQANGVFVAQTEDYPTLVDCPLVILGGGFTSLTFPVQPGDQCLILFNDRDLNNWFAGARSGPVASANLHSFSDAIALVGFPTVTSYSSTHALLSNGNAEVGVLNSVSSQVRIANDLTTLGSALGSLTSILQTLFTAMSAATPLNVTTTVGVPSGVAASELPTVTADLESLLE